MKQAQFLSVIDEQEAHLRFDQACAHLHPRTETIPLDAALGRRLSLDVRATRDVPGFDRSDRDGFAVRSEDTHGATETHPRFLHIQGPRIQAGRASCQGSPELEPGSAISVATGASLPRGADAVIMVEDTAPVPGDESQIEVQRAAPPGEYITWAGSDLASGEIVVRPGTELTSRETGLLAAIGCDCVQAIARPKAAVISTGDEVRAPGEDLALGEVFDSNGRILADAVTECGGTGTHLGITGDDEAALHQLISQASQSHDLILLSGGTSKGAGDLTYRVVRRLAEETPGSPGIVVHGVALKPGKPICLAVVAGKPIAVLPGFPTSAIFTFHEFIAPLVRRLAGGGSATTRSISARTPMRIPSGPGRTEYCLVDLVEGPGGLSAYPLGTGSGSVSTFSRADGFVRIPRNTEFVPADTEVAVHPLSRSPRTPDLVAIGSHCIGLDWLLSRLNLQGHAVKGIAVGSEAGLLALGRGEGDVAGTHLLDPATGTYNRPFLPEGATVLGGYTRRQGLVHRPEDARFASLTSEEDWRRQVAAEGVRMVNRNPGSGTRVLIDRFLEGSPAQKPAGHATQVKSHHAVAAAVAQGRADWGITLERLAEDNGLGFSFMQDEHYEIVALEERLDRPAVEALRRLLASEEARDALATLGCTLLP